MTEHPTAPDGPPEDPLEAEEIHTRHEGSFDARELEAIESRSQISPPAIFETIRREGLEELSRPASALILSAFVAGIALGFSVLTKALLRQHLPDESWRPLVENLGYSVGFLIVILGQLQLFTENTITAVAPAIDAPSRRLLGALLRLWALVLVFNLVGAALFGWILWAARGMDPDLAANALALSHHALRPGGTEILTRGIGAGWLVAALVWVMPNSEGGRIWLIVLFTWLIGVAGFAHVVAGTTEATLVAVAEDQGVIQPITGFILPALIGNLIGGTLLFTVLTYAQIRGELYSHSPDSPRRRPRRP